MSETIAGIKIPDSKMAKDLTELIRDKEPDLLYHHSRRKDRFRFDDRHGDGDYYCHQCGAGKGISLVMKVNGWDYAEAAKRVDEIIGNVKLAA